MTRQADCFELTGEIHARQRLCEFVVSGGRIMTTDNQDGWCDTTADTMLREQKRIRHLVRLRESLYPGFAASLTPPFPYQSLRLLFTSKTAELGCREMMILRRGRPGSACACQSTGAMDREL